MRDKQIFKNEIFGKFLENGGTGILKDCRMDFGLSQSNKRVNSMHFITTRRFLISPVFLLQLYTK